MTHQTKARQNSDSEKDQVSKLVSVVIIMALGGLVLAGCSEGTSDSPEPPPVAGEERTLLVLPSKRECQGEALLLCIVTSETDEAAASTMFAPINGFDFAWGTQYEIRVSVTTVNNPPADGSSLRFDLLETLSAETLGGETTVLLANTTLVLAESEDRFQLIGGGEFTCALDDCDELAQAVAEEGILALTLVYPDNTGDPMSLLEWSGASGTEVSLFDTNWSVTLLNGTPAIDDAIPDLYVGFNEISGSTGCQDFSGEANVTSGNFFVSELELVDVPCTDSPELAEQEAAYLEALLATRRYVTDGETLFLFDSFGNSLELARQDLL